MLRINENMYSQLQGYEIAKKMQLETRGAEIPRLMDQIQLAREYNSRREMIQAVTSNGALHYTADKKGSSVARPVSNREEKKEVANFSPRTYNGDGKVIQMRTAQSNIHIIA